MTTLPLFERFPALGRRVTRVPIGLWPTPVQSAPRFAQSVNIESLHIKREDLSHSICGGNKVRGLEFLLGRTDEIGAKRIVTFSSAGSHHIAKTAYHAGQRGIDTIAIFVDQPPAEYVWRNMSTAMAGGARYIHTNRLTVLPVTALVFARERMRGRVMYIAPGGTTSRAMLGHVNAAFELKHQIDAGKMPEPDCIFVALGSLGTAAGLLLGLKLAKMRSRVVGVTVSYRWYATRGRVARFARRLNRWMRRIDACVPIASIARDDITVVSTALGRGYAHFTPRAEALAKTMFEQEGVATDGTYTAKTLDGMLQYIEDNRLQSAPHLFWHTFHEAPSRRIDGVPFAVRRYFEATPQAWPIDGFPSSCPVEDDRRYNSRHG